MPPLWVWVCGAVALVGLYVWTKWQGVQKGERRSDERSAKIAREQAATEAAKRIKERIAAENSLRKLREEREKIEHEHAKQREAVRKTPDSALGSALDDELGK